MQHDLTIYISGLYSGSNPQPGVGIARSLRQGFPQAKLIGVDYSNRSSGIHWQDFDDIWLQRPWKELNLPAHAAAVRRVLDSGALWISSIDLEILWLARIFRNGHQNLLTPPLSALRRTAKPAIVAHCGLPVKIPAFVTTELSDWDLHAFCRKNDWNVWLKGPYYEAVRTPTWSDLQHWRNVLSSAWNTDKLFLQSHVTGYEESIMLCAYRGELTGSMLMRKRDLTELSKTWAGDSSPVPEELLVPLKKIIRDLNWTGGAELEMVRDVSDRRWLLEWNPRFPAWVHGATITGTNLPAALVEAASGITAEPTAAEADEFTRVVLEIPVRRQFPLSPLPEPLAGEVGHSLKHPSGLIDLARKLHSPASLNGNGTEQARQKGTTPQALPTTFIEDLRNIDFSNLRTPASVFFEKTAADSFERAAVLASGLSSRRLAVSNAYSIKTNPDEQLLRLALRSGFFAEAISLPEMQRALDVGFRPHRIILNGPGKWWRSEEFGGTEVFCVFCDSIDELCRVARYIAAGRLQTLFLGFRLRTCGVRSRFGIPVDTPDDFDRLVNSVTQLPHSVKLGMHFHMASSSIGVRRWQHLFESMVRWGSSIEALTGRQIELLDIGGGWFPDDFAGNGDTRFQTAIRRVSEFLPDAGRLIAEPGKALAQPSMALAVRILEIRRSNGEPAEAVVDGSVAELPMHFHHPHRILARVRDGWRVLGRGRTALLGRLCMEHDILATDVALPYDAIAGDILVFCDAGAYDRSMSYVFGCG